MIGLERGTVELRPYDSEWPRVYEREGERLRSIPAVDDAVLAFEHVGSTAVEGLSAKPVIDMLAILDREADAENVRSTLETHGYEHRPNDAVDDRIFLAKGPRQNRTHYLSLTDRGSDTHLEQVAFREYLREHSRAAAEYDRLKRTLAARYPDDRASYTTRKSEFVETVLERARDE